MASIDLRAAAQQALEALQNCANGEDDVLLTRDALANLRAALAEPQEPDSPERRCGGPGCDMRCCQPVQEPQGCAHCNHPLYAAVKCRVCGRVTEPVQEPVAYASGRTLHWHEGKGVNDAQLFAAPPQRKPLTEAEIDEVWNSLIATPDFSRVKITRAIERAHGIKE